MLTIFLSVSCASLGTKTLYNNHDKTKEIRIKSLIVPDPYQKNVEFYSDAAAENYRFDVQKILNDYNIEMIPAVKLKLPFDELVPNKKLDLQIEGDYILVGNIIRKSAFGKTTDFRVDYKIIDNNEKQLLYHSKFSTTFGKTTVGIPSEEKLMRDAIKSGFHNIKKDIFSRNIK